MDTIISVDETLIKPCQMIRFMKVPLTTYVLQYKRGTIKRAGAGLSFFYWAPNVHNRGGPAGERGRPICLSRNDRRLPAGRRSRTAHVSNCGSKRLAWLLDFT